jgi:hypothetical protein
LSFFTQALAVQARCEEVLGKYLQLAASESTSFSSNPPVLMGLCCSLAVLEALEEVTAPTYLHMYVPLVVKALQKAAREAATQAQQQQQAQQGQPMNRRQQQLFRYKQET